MEYYTYHICWTNLNMHYYGVRGTQKDPKQDLWNDYFTSSKYVKLFRKEHGEPDLIEVRKVFGDRAKALKWERTVLVRMRTVKSPHWLNRYSGAFHGTTGPRDYGWKISRALKGRKRSRDVVERINKNPEKIRKTAEAHRGQKRSDEAKQHMSDKRKQILEENGGALNKGQKLYYDPTDPTQTVQCLPGDAPMGWINGNPKKRGKKPYIHIETKTIKWLLNEEVDDGWMSWNPNKRTTT